jgi:hypothetical protein
MLADAAQSSTSGRHDTLKCLPEAVTLLPSASLLSPSVFSEIILIATTPHKDSSHYPITRLSVNRQDLYSRYCGSYTECGLIFSEPSCRISDPGLFLKTK